MKIGLAEGLALPDDAAVQVYAFLGRRGSGKTYGAGRLVEQVIEVGAQVVILDPVGTWWGLRLKADGHSAGIKIPVFGGLHGDIPLEATAGKVVAELAAIKGTSLVLDVSSFNGAEQRRFVTDFAMEFFQAKKRHRTPVLVVFEEAQEFAPQKVSGEVARMLGAVEKMIKLGRNYGIGTALLSQRPQAVNKDVLNQAEALFCFQMTGPQERKTVAGWVSEKGAEGRDVGDELPALPVGTAMMWSPQWLQRFGKFKILPKRTYDASATPNAEMKESAPLAPIDLKAVQEAMAATVEAAKANDPSALQAQIRALRAQIKDKGTGNFSAETVALKREVDRLKREAKEDRRIFERIMGVISGGVDSYRAHYTPLVQVEVPVRNKVEVRAPLRIASPPPGEYKPFHPVFSGGPATGGIKRMLAALASSRKDGLTKRELGALSAVKKSGGTFGTYLSTMRAKGWIGEPDGSGLIRITPEGRAEAGECDQPTGGRALLDFWTERLTLKQAQMLTYLYNSNGPVSRVELATAANLEATAGTFGTYLSALVSKGLVERAGQGAYTLSQVFAD